MNMKKEPKIGIEYRAGSTNITSRTSPSCDGGAGSGEHFVDVFKAGCADAALAASIFHFGIHDVRELKAQLQREGIPMRLPC